jgi:hypothetical protein
MCRVFIIVCSQLALGCFTGRCPKRVS